MQALKSVKSLHGLNLLAQSTPSPQPVNSSSSHQSVVTVAPEVSQQEANDAELLARLYDLFANNQNKEAIALLKETIKERNSHWAQYYLGLCCLHGIGIGRDESQAITLFSDAATGGNMRAQTELGLRCFEGRGVTQNIKEAKNWLEMAAEQESQDADLMLHTLWLIDDPSKPLFPAPLKTTPKEAKTATPKSEPGKRDDSKTDTHHKPNLVSEARSSSFFGEPINIATKPASKKKKVTIHHKKAKLRLKHASNPRQHWM